MIDMYQGKGRRPLRTSYLPVMSLTVSYRTALFRGTYFSSAGMNVVVGNLAPQLATQTLGLT